MAYLVSEVSQGKLFGATSTTEDVLSGIDLTGKRISAKTSRLQGYGFIRRSSPISTQLRGKPRALGKAVTNKCKKKIDAQSCTPGGSFLDKVGQAVGYKDKLERPSFQSTICLQRMIVHRRNLLRIG